MRVRDHRGSVAIDWIFRRLFVRLLHLPGIWFTGVSPSERFQAFGDLYGVGRCLLEWELELCPEIDDDDLQDDYFMDPDNPFGGLFVWIKDTRDIINTVLDEMAEVAYEPHQTIAARFFPNSAQASQPQLTRDELLLRNLVSAIPACDARCNDKGTLRL